MTPGAHAHTLHTKPRVSAACETCWKVPSGQRHRGRVGRARLAGRSARQPARASAAVTMRQPAPSSHCNRHGKGFADQLAGGQVG
eukprot:316553-Pyramimonas_sp.AAC.1